MVKVETKASSVELHIAALWEETIGWLDSKTSKNVYTISCLTVEIMETPACVFYHLLKDFSQII